MKWVKVAGTTFYTLPESALPQPVFFCTYLRDQEIPAQAYFGLVEPEPENAYDPDAVRVSIGLADGTYAPIGHLPRTEPDRKSIKAPKKSSGVYTGLYGHPAILSQRIPGVWPDYGPGSSGNDRAGLSLSFESSVSTIPERGSGGAVSRA